MSPPDPILSPLGLDHLIDERGFIRDAINGTLEHSGLRVVCAPPELLRSLRFVLEQESPGTAQTVLKAAGIASGKSIAQHLDTKLSHLAQPALSALPLEACLVLLERQLVALGWGHIKLDLTDAPDHGVVVARAEHSGFAEALADVEDFADPLIAGVLSGFFEHVSGQVLGCEEVACVRRGAAACTFVITAQERLDPLLPLLGHESADAIIARLKT
jgi:predicted hydrocarbon binding protein